MIANHIHHALEQVQELRRKVLDKQRFKGYSGRARAASGCLALLACLVMNLEIYPPTALAHFQGWVAVLFISLVLNYGALFYWFWFDPLVGRDFLKLRPVLDMMPPVIIGGIFTMAFVVHRDHDYLAGMWMCLFGLSNIASRHVLPRQISWLGLYYVLCGMILLILGTVPFTNPWPMGLVFFVGEWVGGFILHYDEPRRFFSFKKIAPESNYES